MNETLASELVFMRRRDLKIRQQLLDAGQLSATYNPVMEEVHRSNAARLREIIAVNGWPNENLVGKSGAEAAWFIVQHAIGEPDFQRATLVTLQDQAAQGEIPAWHPAYLEDRIAMYEGRPQRYGTQWMDDPVDGEVRPWKLEDPDRINELRASVGLDPMRPIPEPGPALPEIQQEELRTMHANWEEWMVKTGWRK